MCSCHDPQHKVQFDPATSLLPSSTHIHTHHHTPPHIPHTPSPLLQTCTPSLYTHGYNHTHPPLPHTHPPTPTHTIPYHTHTFPHHTHPPTSHHTHTLSHTAWGPGGDCLCVLHWAAGTPCTARTEGETSKKETAGELAATVQGAQWSGGGPQNQSKRLVSQTLVDIDPRNYQIWQLAQQNM